MENTKVARGILQKGTAAKGKLQTMASRQSERLLQRVGASIGKSKWKPKRGLISQMPIQWQDCLLDI